MVLQEHTRLPVLVAEALKHLATFPPSESGPEKARGAALLVTGSPGIGKSYYSFIPPGNHDPPGRGPGWTTGAPSGCDHHDRAPCDHHRGPRHHDGDGLRLDRRGVVNSAHRISLVDFRPASDPDLGRNATVYYISVYIADIQ